MQKREIEEVRLHEVRRNIPLNTRATKESKFRAVVSGLSLNLREISSSVRV
jgi:hypothetical protein